MAISQSRIAEPDFNLVTDPIIAAQQAQATTPTVNEDYNKFLMGVYRDQLGREPDAGGLL